MNDKEVQQIRDEEYHNYLTRVNSDREKASKNLARKILKKHGYFVYPEFVYTPTPSSSKADIKKSSDGGDILYVNLKRRRGRRSIDVVEVKYHETVKYWTCENDYPYEMMMVDGCSQFDKKTVIPRAYMIFNPTLTNYAVIYVASTRKTWDRFKTFSINKYPKSFYRVPKRLAIFKEVPQSLKKEK